MLIMRVVRSNGLLSVRLSLMDYGLSTHTRGLSNNLASTDSVLRKTDRMIYSLGPRRMTDTKNQV